MMDEVAVALVVAMMAEMRVALHRFGNRVGKVEREQKRIAALHILPPIGAFLAVLLLAGCGGDARPLAPGGSGHGSAASAFANLGNTLVWSGGIAAVVGLVARFAIGPFGGLAIIVAEAGAVTLASGGVVLWISDNPWTTVGCITAVVGAWTWYRWPSLHRWIDSRLQKVKEYADRSNHG